MKNFTFMAIIAISTSKITISILSSSEIKRTPQNKVAVPVIIASISNLLFKSSLYGFTLNCKRINPIKVRTAVIAAYTKGTVDINTLMATIKVFLIVFTNSQ